MELTDLQIEIMIAAVHGDNLLGYVETEDLHQLVAAGFLAADEDEFELYDYEITDDGEALVTDLELV